MTRGRPTAVAQLTRAPPKRRLEFEARGECYTAATLEHAFRVLKAASHEGFRQDLESPTALAAWEAGRRLDPRPDA